MGACAEGELLLLIDVNEIDTPVNTLQSYSQLPHTSQSMPIIIRQQQPHVIKLFPEQSLFSARCHECMCGPITGLISDQRLSHLVKCLLQQIEPCLGHLRSQGKLSLEQNRMTH